MLPKKSETDVPSHRPPATRHPTCLKVHEAHCLGEAKQNKATKSSSSKSEVVCKLPVQSVNVQPLAAPLIKRRLRKYSPKTVRRHQNAVEDSNEANDKDAKVADSDANCLMDQAVKRETSQSGPPSQFSADTRHNSLKTKDDLPSENRQVANKSDISESLACCHCQKKFEIDKAENAVGGKIQMKKDETEPGNDLLHEWDEEIPARFSQEKESGLDRRMARSSTNKKTEKPVNKPKKAVMVGYRDEQGGYVRKIIVKEENTRATPSTGTAYNVRNYPPHQ